MAQVKFEDINDVSSQVSPNSIGYFGLKNDGDEAVVRFMHDDVSTFEILTVHDIVINGKHRKINCIRDPHDPLEKCPLCKNGTQIQQRIYIHLLHYVKDDSGNVVVIPKIWERSMKYASTLKMYIDNYGPLSDVLFKIIRHGAAGNMQTTYEILPIMNKTVYRDDIYVKDTLAFKDYSVVGNMVMDRTSDDITAYINTGNFPMLNNNPPFDTADSIPTPYAPINYNQNFQQANFDYVMNMNERRQAPTYANTISNPQDTFVNTVTPPIRQY